MLHPSTEGVGNSTRSAVTWAETGAEVEGSPIRRAIASARSRMLELQEGDGHWCGELEGGSILESEYLLMLYFLGRFEGQRVERVARYLRGRQGEDGGWSDYPGGPSDVSSSIKAYFVLKLVGDSADSAPLRRARQCILELGGVEAANTYTKIYLAMFGQYPWSRCPAIPPEIVLLPRWLYFNLYAMSSWSRAIFVPLSIIWARKPSIAVPKEVGISELTAPSKERPSTPPGFWPRAFQAVNGALVGIESARFRPLRRLALERAERWMEERLDRSAGLGAIFPAIVNSILAFRCLGYDNDHPRIAEQLAELEALEIIEDDTVRLEPCKSPVWDTGNAVEVLLDSGSKPEAEALAAAARWLIDREVRQPGDWRILGPDVEPSGWYFEYANEFYPDCDDTAQVLTALAKVRLTGVWEERREETTRRAARWLVAMQNSDGGWAAFDRDCDRAVLAHIPFADHNAMLDPSCADITGRALCALAELGFERQTPAVDRALAYLLREQNEDGAWFGRWGCNYLYGTWKALCGMAAYGDLRGERAAERAADWLRGRQNADGGWGESLASYTDPGWRGRGESTASQTAWALMGLVATGDSSSPSVRRGVDRLLSTQRADGSWSEDLWTGTGFPGVFYLRYHLYASYYPLQALAHYARARAERRGRHAA